MNNYQLELLKLFFIIAFSFGLWTCISLILTRRNDIYIRSALILYLLLLMTNPLNAYLHLLSEGGVKFFTLLSQTLSWAYGPLLLILVNSLLLKRFGPGKSFLHFIPFVLVTLLHLLDQSWLPRWLYISVLYLQVGIYLLLTVILCVKHKFQLGKLKTHYRNSSYYWSMHLSIGLVILMAWDLTIVTCLFFGLIDSLDFNIMLASIYSVYISSLALLFIRQPDFAASESDSNEAGLANNEEEIANPSLRVIELTPDAAKEIKGQLEKLTQTHQIYLDNDISLGKLASLLNISAHQLSELFNIHMQTSYYDYLNHWRYEESLKHLQNPNHDFSVTDIAYRSGFNNRSTFYKVFKEKTGMTPTEYKTRLSANS